MFIGAFLNAGMPLNYLNKILKQMNLPFHRVAVVENLYSNDNKASHFKWHQEIKSRDISSEECAQNEWNGFENIVNKIYSSDVELKIRKNAGGIFSYLAEIGIDFKYYRCDEINFGCIDAIYNILAVIIGLNYFNIRKVFSSEIPVNLDLVSRGAKALNISDYTVLNLLKKKKAFIKITASSQESINAESAVLLASLAIFEKPEMKLTNIGIGAIIPAGEQQRSLKILIGKAKAESNETIEIETNIDDMSSQICGYVMDELFAHGALDVYFTPIYMKKNRPGIKITVLGRKIDQEKLYSILLRETSTLGVRSRTIQGHAGSYKTASVKTKYGEIPIKLKILDGKIIQVTPEYDVCAAIAKTANVGLQHILQEVIAAGTEKYSIDC